jgi:hypothetical protein
MPSAHSDREGNSEIYTIASTGAGEDEIAPSWNPADFPGQQAGAGADRSAAESTAQPLKAPLDR